MVIASDVVYDMTAARNVPQCLTHLLKDNGVAILVLPAVREVSLPLGHHRRAITRVLTFEFHHKGICMFEQRVQENGFVMHRTNVPSQGNDDSLNFYLLRKGSTH